MAVEKQKVLRLNDLALGAVLRRFQRCRILVVGDLVADHYIYGQTERISREAPVLIVRHEHSEVQLGGGANVAANASALGANVCVVGLLGHDEMGRELETKFRSLNIELRAVKSPDIRTETKTRILAGGVNTTRQQMLRVDYGQTGQVLKSMQKQLAAKLLTEAQGADAVIVSDYGAGVFGAEVKATLKTVMQLGIPICVDSRHDLASFQGATVCKPNEPELAELLQRPIRSESELFQAGEDARRALNCENLIVTRGRNGMALFQEGTPAKTLPVYGQQEAVDVTGAGDTVVSALAVSLACKATPWQAVNIANVAGGLVVQKQGTATVTRGELARALEVRI